MIRGAPAAALVSAESALKRYAFPPLDDVRRERAEVVRLDWVRRRGREVVARELAGLDAPEPAEPDVLARPGLGAPAAPSRAPRTAPRAAETATSPAFSTPARP